MNLLYQNRGSEDQAFIKFVCEDVLSQVCKNKAKNNSFAGIFVDGRNREINSLEDFACFHSFYTYSEYAYPIFVFVKNTKNFLNNNLELIDKYNIQISEISALDSLEKYSDFCINELYFKIPYEIENLITLQPDGMLMKNGYEEYVLKNNFTYVGSPWLHSPAIEVFMGGSWHPFFLPTRVGNGGLSYRKASFCRQASSKFGDLILRERFAEGCKKPPEDLFYSVVANALGGTLNVEQAKKFSIDPLDKIDYNNKASYAFHYFSAINPWKQK